MSILFRTENLIQRKISFSSFEWPLYYKVCSLTDKTFTKQPDLSFPRLIRGPLHQPSLLNSKVKNYSELHGSTLYVVHSM